jgi:hypothetical protein
VPFGLSLLARCEWILVHNDDVLASAQALGLPRARLRVLEDVPAPPPARRSEALPSLLAQAPRPWVLYPGSFSADEPVGEVLHAARLLNEGTVIVTGRRHNAARNGHDLDDLPRNVVLTDYLPQAEFEALLEHSDVVLALTRFDGIQLSVCNEALGWAKPMVMSDTPLLRRLFGRAAVCVDSSDPHALVRGMREAWQQRAALATAAAALADERRAAWQQGALRQCLALLRPAARAQQP